MDLLIFKEYEVYSGLFLIKSYITSYTCEGRENSVVWGDAMKEILNTYVDDGNSDKNLRLFCASVMNNVSNKQSTPRAQCIYAISGGNFKISSF